MVSGELGTSAYAFSVNKNRQEQINTKVDNKYFFSFFTKFTSFLIIKILGNTSCGVRMIIIVL